MKTVTLYILTFLLITFENKLSADTLIVFSDVKKVITIGKALQILEDKNDKLTIDKVSASKDFQTNNQTTPNFGVTSSSFWLKFYVKNISESNTLLLELSHPLIDELTLYSIKPNDQYEIQKTGELYSYSQRIHKYQNYLLDLKIPKNTTALYILKIKSGKQIQLPLRLGTSESLYNSNITNELIFGIYFGIIIITVLYNLFIYFSVRDKSYLYYVVYAFSIGLTQACLRGYTSRYLWPNSSWMISHGIFIIVPIGGILSVLFANNFLQTKKHSPIVHNISYLIIAIYSTSIVLGILDKQILSSNIIDFSVLLLTVYLLYTAIKISILGYRPAKFFLFAWSSFLICIIIYVMKHQGAFPNNNLTNYILELGSAIEVTLLSFALADRINILKKEKEESQAQTLLALKENEKIIINQNILLESKVKERTYELEASNKELKDTQTQLVSVEKMASLGQLTAGIAHEINNPINFVISNIKPLRRDVEEILQLLAKYGEISNDIDLKEKLKEIDTLKQTLDTDYVIDEINLLLKGIDEGAYRTSEIVRGLQSFSRLDESDLKRVNIHEGIDATLILLNNNIVSEKIQIIKDYEKALPPVECYPGKLNQSFMNIINNAIQSLAARNNKQAEGGKIIIKTKAEGNSIVISIKDNGIGIPENIKDKIFEPFFTTKDVGSGTGLGLSIVYGIIQSHKGNISVESEEGKGAEFIITLPIAHS